jgi:hypothetical protein
MAAATIALRRRLSSRGISPWPARSPAGAVLPAVCAAFAAFAEKRYAEVVALLEPVRRDFVRLGGSGAQRRVLEETLEAARERAARGG